MISSRRGLAIVGALALVLVLAVLRDLRATRAVIDHALLPGFAADRVTELIWEHPGQPALRALRAGAGWQLAGAGLPADESAISDVLATLRGARWHRRGEPVRTDVRVTIIAGAERRVLGLGPPIAGTSQRWIRDGERGLVVDDWVVRALDREPLALRLRTPLADVARAQQILVARSEPKRVLWLEGTPRRLVRPVALALAGTLAGELERALRDLTIVRLPTGPATARGLTIELAAAAVPSVTVMLGGACPGAPELIALSGSAGDGCVERGAAEAVERAVDHLAQPAEVIVERRPIAWEPRRLALPDGIVLDLATGRVGDVAADPARVAELLAALAAPAEVAPVPAHPAERQLVVSDRTGAAVTLELHGERVLVRRGEPVALRPAPGAWALLVRPSRALRDLALWLEEPTTIAAVQIDGVRYRRGAVIGAWSREPVGPVDAMALDAVVELLAAPRALDVLAAAAPVAHRVTLVIAPPAGAPTERVVELGAATAAGCPATAAGENVMLPAALCARVATLAR